MIKRSELGSAGFVAWFSIIRTDFFTCGIAKKGI